MPIQDSTSVADELLLGRYRIHEMRAEGGFGTVYICWDPRLMRRVAIKSIGLNRSRRSSHEASHEEALLKAALDETRIVSMLSHPNIVQMIDFESDDTNAYIIMEYVEGASLAELLDATDDGLLTMDEAAAVVESVCDALQFAHENGVLHLDIKPDNIMIDMNGRIKLTDFGMATLSSITGYSGARGGTAGYMPPEQARGEQVGVCTDIFAFAAVLYEALCGHRPFAAQTIPESLELVLAGAPDPCALSDTIPVGVADILLQCLDPDPAVRISSAEGFAAAIMPYLGRPKSGRKSLAAFVADVMDDSKNDTEADETAAPNDPASVQDNNTDPDEGLLGEASGRIARLVCRAMASLCPAFVSALAIYIALTAAGISTAAGAAASTAAGNSNLLTAVIVFAIVAAIGLPAPQLTSACAPMAVGIACIMTSHVLFGIALIIVGLLWWFFFGRVYPESGSATFMSCMAPASMLPLSPLINGYLLPCAHAAANSAMAAFIQISLLLLAETIGVTTSGGLISALGLGTGGTATINALSTANLVCALSWICAAALQSAVSGGFAGSHPAAGTSTCAAGADATRTSHAKLRCYIGVLVGGLCIGLFQYVSMRMDNAQGSVLAGPEAYVAIIGSVIVVLLLVLCFGSRDTLDLDTDSA